MDVLSKKNDVKLSRHRFTPQKEPHSNSEYMDFSFSEWKHTQIKRSPTSSEIKRKINIKDFYTKEQKKIIKIHRSFDSRNLEQNRVKEMNNYIKRLVNEHALLKKKLAEQDIIIKNFNTKIKSDESEQFNSTPCFNKVQNKLKFPRDVFSSRSKKLRL